MIEGENVHHVDFAAKAKARPDAPPRNRQAAEITMHPSNPFAKRLQEFRDASAEIRAEHGLRPVFPLINDAPTKTEKPVSVRDIDTMFGDIKKALSACETNPGDASLTHARELLRTVDKMIKEARGLVYFDRFEQRTDTMYYPGNDNERDKPLM